VFEPPSSLITADLQEAVNDRAHEPPRVRRQQRDATVVPKVVVELVEPGKQIQNFRNQPVGGDALDRIIESRVGSDSGPDAQNEDWVWRLRGRDRPCLFLAIFVNARFVLAPAPVHLATRRIAC